MSEITPQFFLASESPRRKKILEEHGYQFTLLPIKVSERIDKNLNSKDQIRAIAEEKMAAARDQAKLLKIKNYVILTADTMVYFQGHPFGKPENSKHAVEMLSLMSGNSHWVHTAVCVFDAKTQLQVCEVASTEVLFKRLSQNEIQNYVQSGEPMDKAGAYGAQGRGREFIESLHGDFDTVVGLPMKVTQALLLRFGVQSAK